MLFTDIEGSTERWERSPEMAELVERHFRVLHEVVTTAGGVIFSEMGDGVAAAFDSTGAALRAALDAQLRLLELGLDVRMGLHTGEVERVGDDLRGRAVNRAARIMALARSGQVLVSDVTARLVRSGPSTHPFDLADVGVYRLRGLFDPEHIWQLVHPGLEMRAPRPTSNDDVGSGGAGSSFVVHRTPLVGRDHDRLVVADRLYTQRIVTLCGVGGVGKTRLALDVAAQQQGLEVVELVPLASLSAPDDVAAAVAGVLGAPLVLDPCDAVATSLAGKAALLVIDNCEHVIDGAANVVDRLISACPGLRVLATSREPLGVDGEHVIQVRPLEVSTHAVELFRQRATAAGADLDHVPRSLVERLCEQLDGVPLAIELVAARSATLGIGEIVEAIAVDSALPAATRRRSAHADRHASLEAAIWWSYRLMTEGEQRLFRWMAAFPGGFELEAARVVGATLGLDARTVAAHVESLVAKSMLDHDRPRTGAGTTVRYRMLETVRAFARERLDEVGERDAASIAMAGFVASIAGPQDGGPCSEAVERCSIRLEHELDNWREAAAVAARLGSSELAAALCGPPAAFTLLGRHDLADLVRPLLGRCTCPADRQAVLTALIVTTCGTAEPAQLWALATEVQAIDDERAGGPIGLGGLMRWLALAWRGEFDASIEVCLSAADDNRLHQQTRDLFVGIAVLDRFSLTAATPEGGDPALDPLARRAAAVAERCEMALARISCLLGVAWASADADPVRSIELVERALQHIADVPPLTRLTLPGSASRLLSRLEPRVAAQALLDRIDEQRADAAPRRTFTEMIPLFYGAALLEHVGDPTAAPTMATVTASPTHAPASMMDFIDQARRAVLRSDRRAVEHLESVVRTGLAELAVASSS
jgi:predicted ATPase